MKWLGRLFIYAIFLIFTTLFGLEVLLRLVFPAPSLAYAQKFRQDIPGLKNEFVYDRNAWGLRSLGMKTLEKPASTLRVIVLGASTTDQATQNTADTWSGILEKKMTQSFASKNLRVEVAAYGRGGDTIYDTLCWAKDNLPQLNPDLVIVLQAINDMAWNGGEGYHFDSKNPPRCSGFMTRFLRHHSDVFRWVIHLKNQIRVKKALAQGGAVEWHSQNLPEIRRKFSALPLRALLTRDPDPYVEFAQGMKELAQQLVDWKITTLFLSQPSVWHENMTEDESSRLWFSINTPQGPVRLAPALMAREMQRYNERVLWLPQEFPEASIHFFGLAATLPRTADIFFDDCHLTDAGSQAVAGAILPEVNRILSKR